jgi:hypothetical protein
MGACHRRRSQRDAGGERFALQLRDPRPHRRQQLGRTGERQLDAARVLEIELLAQRLHAVQDLAEQALRDQRIVELRAKHHDAHAAGRRREAGERLERDGDLVGRARSAAPQR